MLESILTGLGYLLEPATWGWILGGTLLGLVLGLIPGLGSLIGMALFLPFTFKLDVMQAMPFMVALSAVGFTGGSVTAVLLGVPGDASNIATMLDGHPMTQKGEGARAIGAALTASLVGGIMATGFAVIMMFAIMPIIMSITSREMVFIILIGLAFISMLGNEGRIKSLISGCLGLMLSCVGMVMVSGEVRFTFDQGFLFEGLPIVPVCFGLFAVPPMVELAMKGRDGTISNVAVSSLSIKDTLKGSRDVLRNKFLCLRCAVIGYFFGILPGVGANAAVFMAYGHAKATDAHPDSFGGGNVRGVIGPESCNNAKESGSWLTTFALGVPGSTTGAIGLGALMMLGVMPGPGMLTEHLDITFSLLMIVALANVIGFILCFPLVAPLARVATIPARILVPLVLVFIVVGTYANRSLMEDIALLLLFSVVGLAVKRFKYNAGSLLLGYILGAMLENYLFISLQIEGITFFMHPIPLFLMACLAIFLAWPGVRNIMRGRMREC